ncbi:MAG TPA: signal peptide peptidase SppA [Thermoanaerobaculia bacterium]|nr:signal peptide peptidase SppA [Thermoanaerobaculia bacterium]
MRRSTKVLLVVLVLAVVTAGVVVLAALAWWMGSGRVPSRTILEVDVEEAFFEYIPEGDPFAALWLKDKMRLRDFVAALAAAAEDDRVVGLVARVAPMGGIGLGQIEEMRRAVAAFRAAGKPAIAFADTFGEISAANGAYYLASAFDEVYIQPSGDVGLTGLLYTSPFVRGTLDKIGVEPEMAQRYEYKNAMNTFTETGYTEAHREAMEALASSTFEHMVGEIAAVRDLDPARLRALVDRGPFLGEEAADSGLVDGLLYRDQVYDRIEELGAAANGGGEPGLLYLRKYWQRAKRPKLRGPAIGLVYGVGAVVRGDSEYDPFGGGFVMGGETVAAALRAAVEDDDVAAIILRVDSPGGSYVASDMVWREVRRAREAGKPVIASMGNVAASGGYFVAMAADKIVAEPTTITGSIGVLGGKLVTTDMWQKLGISFDSVQTSEHADMFSSVHEFDPGEWQRFNAWLDRVYDDFTGKVAEGRGLPLERVRQVAKGRVWSGVDAHRIGLVDELGGLDVAERLAREAAGIGPEERVELREFPRPTSPFEALFGEGPDNSEGEAVRAVALRLLETVRPLAAALEAAGLREREARVLRMPDVWLPQ